MKNLILFLFTSALVAQTIVEVPTFNYPDECEKDKELIAFVLQELTIDSVVSATAVMNFEQDYKFETALTTADLTSQEFTTEAPFYRVRVVTQCKIECRHQARYLDWEYAGSPYYANVTGYSGITGQVFGNGQGFSYEYYVDCGSGWVLGDLGCQLTNGGDTFTGTVLANGCQIKEVVYSDAACTAFEDEDIKIIPTPDVVIDTTGFGIDSLVTITFDNLTHDTNAVDSNYVCLYANGSQWCLPSFAPTDDIDVADLEPCSIGTGGMIELDWNCFGYDTLIVKQCVTHYYPDALEQIVCDYDTLTIISADPLCCEFPQVNYTDWTFTAGEAGAGQTGINLGANVGSYQNTIATHGDINSQAYTLTITDLTGAVFYTLNDNFDATGAINGTTGINVDGSNFGADGTYVATITTTTSGGANLSFSISFSIIAGNFGIPDPNANLGVAPKFIGSKDQPSPNNRDCPLNWGIDLLGINGSSIDTGVLTTDVGTVEIVGVGTYVMGDFVDIEAGLYEFITTTQIPNSQLTVNQIGWIEIVPCP